PADPRLPHRAPLLRREDHRGCLRHARKRGLRVLERGPARSGREAKPFRAGGISTTTRNELEMFMSSVQSTANVSAASIGLRISLWVGQVLLMGMFLMAGSADPGPLIL